ncbi:MAG: hypothetical protein AB7D51_07105 [Desulfovibrionaceae bacterium]
MQETIRARVESELKERFEHAARSRGATASSVLRGFMAEYVDEHEEELRRREETLLAMETIEAGRFVEGAEVFAWLDTWGTDGEAAAPECE